MKDSTGQQLAYVYFEDEPAASIMTSDGDSMKLIDFKVLTFDCPAVDRRGHQVVMALLSVLAPEAGEARKAQRGRS